MLPASYFKLGKQTKTRKDARSVTQPIIQSKIHDIHILLTDKSGVFNATSLLPAVLFKDKDCNKLANLFLNVVLFEVSYV